MDGFRQGVEKYNKDKGTDVQLARLGRRQKGSFTNDFEDKTKGQSVAEDMISQGADIIFPVAGPAGLGGAPGRQGQRGVNAIWVDTDGCVSAAEYCDVLLTSVMKGMDVAVEDGASRPPSTATSTTSAYIGTLENGGVGLAPYHELRRRGPARAQGQDRGAQAAASSTASSRSS